MLILRITLGKNRIFLSARSVLDPNVCQKVRFCGCLEVKVEMNAAQLTNVIVAGPRE